MRINTLYFTGLVLLFLQLSCANIKLVSSENHQLKFCTNPGNKIAKTSDFDEAASKQCGGNYRNVSEGLEFFTDPKSKKLGGVLEIQTERHMCRVYECIK